MSGIVGDYVTRLLMDTAGFDSGAQRAGQSAQSLGNNFDRMMNQMDRLEQRMRASGERDLERMLGLKGGPVELPGYMDKLAAGLDKLSQARSKLASASSRPVDWTYQTGLTPDVEGRMRNPDFLAKHATSTEAQKFMEQRERLERGMDAAGAKPWAREASRSKLEDEQRAAVEERISTQAKVEANATQEKENRLLAEFTRQARAAEIQKEKLTLAELRGKRASEESINAQQRRVHDLELAGISDPALKEQARKQLLARDAADPWGQGQKRGGSQWAMMQGAIAIEDFIQGSQYGGLRGGLLAASNNISAMGAAFGAYGAMAGSAISTTVILGSLIWDTWVKAESGANKAAEAVRNYTSEISRAVSEAQSLRNLTYSFTDMLTSGGDPNEKYKRLTRDLEERRSELADRDRETKKQDTFIGVQGMSAAELERAAKEREKMLWNANVNEAFKWMPVDSAHANSNPFLLQENKVEWCILYREDLFCKVLSGDTSMFRCNHW